MVKLSPLQREILDYATTIQKEPEPFQEHYTIFRLSEPKTLAAAMRLERRGLLTLLSEEKEYSVFMGNDAGRKALEDAARKE